MPVTLRESSVRDAGTIVMAVAAFIVGMRALAVVASIALSHQRWLHGGLGLTLEALTLFLSFFVFCVDSGLTIPILLSATAVALVVGWSLRSVRAIFVSVFVVASAISSPLLSHNVVVVDDAARAGQWASAFKGERTSFAPVTGRCEGVVARHFFVYYDNVRLHEDDRLAPVDCRTVKLVVAPGYIATTAHDDSNETRTGGPGEEKATAELLQRVVSIGERTHLDGLNRFISEQTWTRAHAVASPRWDTVALLGDSSEMRNTILHCRSTPRDSLSSDPCLLAASHTKLRNVTFRVFTSDLLAPAISVFVQAAGTCEGARHQLAQGLGANGDATAARLIRCSEAASATSAARRFLELLPGTAAGTYTLTAAAFVHSMPTFVAWRWYLPDVLRTVQTALAYVVDTVCVPLGATMVVAVESLAKGAQAFGSWALGGIAAATPYLTAFAHHVQNWSLGLLCGNVQQPWLSACALHRSEPAYAVGAQLHDGAVTAAAATLDALEVVPGVWRLVKWGWDTEWQITVGLVRIAAQASTRLVNEALVPAAHASYSAVSAAARTLPRCAGPLGAFRALLGRSSLNRWLRSGVTWVCMEEVREVHAELSMLRLLVAAAWEGVVSSTVAVWRGARAVAAAAEVIMSWYMGTTFSIHLVVVVLQTLLLLLAVRNEIKELVEVERRGEDDGLSAVRSPPTPALVGGLSWESITHTVARRWRKSATVSRVNGIALFVKAHYRTCTNYVVTHAVLIVALVGLSVLPFTGKLYTLTLHFILPWMSSEAFLSFFCVPSPTKRQVGLFWCAHMAFTILLQRTVGNFLYRLVKDLLIASGLFCAAVVSVWAWPRRGVLARQMAVAISESLNNTPIRSVPTPPQAPLLSPDDAEVDDLDVVRRVGLEEVTPIGTALRGTEEVSAPQTAVVATILLEPQAPLSGNTQLSMLVDGLSKAEGDQPVSHSLGRAAKGTPRQTTTGIPDAEEAVVGTKSASPFEVSDAVPTDPDRSTGGVVGPNDGAGNDSDNSGDEPNADRVAVGSQLDKTQEE